MTAFRATFSDMKLVKTRQVAQLIFEIPIEEFDAAYEVLGGMPVPAKERWFGIAAIQEPHQRKEADPKSTDRTPVRASLATDKPSEKPKRDWRDLTPSSQTALRCRDAIFQAFMSERQAYPIKTDMAAAEAIRDICGVSSRALLDTEHAPRVIWHQLDTEYQAWLAKERVGA